MEGKNMSPSFHLTVGDNMAAFRTWHTKTHTLEWADCPYEPCNHLEAEFRRCWR